MRTCSTNERTELGLDLKVVNVAVTTMVHCVPLLIKLTAAGLPLFKLATWILPLLYRLTMNLATDSTDPLFYLPIGTRSGLYLPIDCTDSLGRLRRMSRTGRGTNDATSAKVRASDDSAHIILNRSIESLYFIKNFTA